MMVSTKNAFVALLLSTVGFAIVLALGFWAAGPSEEPPPRHCMTTAEIAQYWKDRCE